MTNDDDDVGPIPGPLDEATTDELFEEFERRLPKGVIMVTAGGCTCGKPDCPDQIFSMRISDDQHPALFIGLLELAKDLVRDGYNSIDLATLFGGLIDDEDEDEEDDDG